MTSDIIRFLICKNPEVFIEGCDRLKKGVSVSEVLEETYQSLLVRPENAPFIDDIGALTLATAYSRFIRGYN